MATTATNLRGTSSYADWFVDFLKKELAPYPGRGTIVARMVISATITMILIMTFRLPGGSIGPLYAFVISRENLLSSARSALVVVLSFAAGAAFIPIGARMFASTPLTHFAWEAVSLFIMFFLLRALRDFNVAVALVTVGTNASAIWYLPGPAETNLELTLWATLVPAVGALVTFAVEAVFHAFNKQDEVLSGLSTRWSAMESLLLSYANNEPVSHDIERRVAQLALVGAGSLRRRLTRSDYDSLYRVQMMAVVSLTARSIDLAAVIAQQKVELSTEERQRIRQLAAHIARIRECIVTKCKPETWSVPRNASSALRLLPDLERMVSLIPRVFEGSISLEPYQESGHEPTTQKKGIFVDDAFQNPEYIKFALTGCLAAMICYILYVSLAWRNLSTAIVTCLLTALSDIGSSRQKQLLRIVGALIGGFIFSMGAQVFILPYIDSIFGFSMLFAAITGIAAWVATSSPRLSYCGLQIAFAYFLVNLNEFTIQTSLGIARDRAVGVLLGIFVMWLVFERFHPKPAAQRMIEVFVENLRLLAQLVVKPGEANDPKSLARLRRLRDQIYQNFTIVNAQADAVPFETGAMRAPHLIAQQKIHRWQAQLRTFYLLEIPLVQFRIFGLHGEMSEPVRDVEHRFQQNCAIILNRMADCLIVQFGEKECTPPPRPELEKLIDSAVPAEEPTPYHRDKTMLAISRDIASLLEGLDDDMSAVPLFQEN
ncbi:MAG TPA: FUSC family protein [Acidisarcina sp.]|nr:FUSC family protein [Acidisarcina sp.]